MKKLFPLMLSLLLVVLGGCVTDDDNDSDNNDDKDTTVGVQASDYFPFSVGNIWTFSETVVDRDDLEPQEVIASIPGTVESNGHAYHLVVIGSDSLYARVDGDKILTNDYVTSRYIPDDSQVFGKPAAAMAAKALAKAVAESNELLWFDFSKQVGEEWPVLEKDQVVNDIAISVNVTGVREASEDLTVPAGTFEDCEVFSSTLAVEMSRQADIEVEGEIVQVSAKYTITLVNTFWLVENIGPVQRYILSARKEEIPELDVENGSQHEYYDRLESYSFAE